MKIGVRPQAKIGVRPRFSRLGSDPDFVGTVYLVGAGPGATDLLTLRAARLLTEAEIVFYDALVHPETLTLAARAEKIAVGKRCGRHTTAQRFINKRLADAARRHRVVVRLKGGDPMLFGRAQEEIAFLRGQGIPVEVVPGVTAALGAAAELKVSLTQRSIARSVVFATPRAAPGEPASNWARAVASADTAVLYMASRDAELVKTELLGVGLHPKTPVAITTDVSLGTSSLRPGVLDNLPQLSADSSGGPALIIVGEVLQSATSSDLMNPGTAQLGTPVKRFLAA